MADLSETSAFSPVTRIEDTTVALGGDEVNSPNLQLKQLVDRTKWLRDQIEAITGAGSINALSLDVLQVAHGFSAKDPIYHNGANWLKSDAGSSVTAIATAIVSNVTDSDNFTLTLAGRITGLTGLTGGRVYYIANGGGIALTPGTIQRPVLVAESSTVGYFAPLYDFPTVENANVAQGRLTFTASTPIMTSDVLAATTLRYTPHIGDKITLWNPTRGHWQQYTFTERTLSLSGLAANTNFDVFIYDNAGTLTLEAIAWSNSGAGTSARASTLSYREGVRVKTSDDRKYLGCFRTTGTIGQSEFSPFLAKTQKVFLWNEFNQVDLALSVADSTSHTYSSATFRAWNNSTANATSFLYGGEVFSTVISGGGNAGGIDADVDVFPYLDTAVLSGISGNLPIVRGTNLSPSSFVYYATANIVAGYHNAVIYESSINAVPVTFQGVFMSFLPIKF